MGNISTGVHPRFTDITDLSRIEILRKPDKNWFELVG
jgi:hypothetical protein